MPTKCGLKDKKGNFCRWGSSGKKYYYDPNDKASKEAARKKANKQGAAARAGGYKGKSPEKPEKVLENVPETAEKEEKCVDCEPKLDEIDQKTTENELKSAGNLQEMVQNDLKTEEIVPEIPKYEAPVDKNSLDIGHFVRYKDKIGKIIKVIQ